MSSCWFAELPGAGACDGRLRKCHLIPARVIRQELDSRRARLRREGVDGIGDLVVVPKNLYFAVTWDPRVWVWGCGGAMGLSGHHGQVDTSRTLRVPRYRLPAAVEEFAEEWALGAWLDREYGERERIGG